MNKKQIVDLIEAFAPLKLQESWDCCGFQIDLGTSEVNKVLICLSVTENIIHQAIEKNCDLIIAHHPLFFIPFSFQKDISIYSVHTNLDKADGGTTDTLINLLDLVGRIGKNGDFLRLLQLDNEIPLSDFINLIKSKLNLKNLKVVNNLNKQIVSKIAFCAGSGAEFLDDVSKLGADVFVTGDVKYHTASESDVIIIDVGHFESERPIVKTIEHILQPLKLEVFIADEKSPFINY